MWIPALEEKMVIDKIVCAKLRLLSTMKLKPFFFTVLLVTATIAGHCQGQDIPMNLVKVNVTSLAFKNISLQYERILDKPISLAFGISTMPESSVPFRNQILDNTGNNPDTKNAIENLRIKSFSFTPEFRFYLGRGYGRGFYIAPFYRYATYSTNTLAFSYQNTLGQDATINLSGKLKANTGGLLFGAQWKLGEHISLDWWILGPHYGNGKGDFAGVSNQPLTPVEQDQIRQAIDDLDIPLTKKTYTVNSGGATMNLDGPWGGIRSGIAIGFRF